MPLDADARYETRIEVPAAVRAWLADKDLQPGFDWQDVWGEEHAAAFTVAKIMSIDVLDDVRTSLVDALNAGEPFEAWSKRLRTVLEEKGWWGEVDVTDPDTGEVKTTDLSTPRRLRTIWSSNIRSARAAGQFERAQRTKRALPFFQ